MVTQFIATRNIYSCSYYQSNLRCIVTPNSRVVFCVGAGSLVEAVHVKTFHVFVE